MSNVRAWLGAELFLVATAPSPARASQPVDDPAVLQERDALIDKIARGDDVDGSVKRFAALVKERDRVVATSRAAKEAEEKARLAEHEFKKEYEKSADHDAGWCADAGTVPADGGLGRTRAEPERIVCRDVERLRRRAPKPLVPVGEQGLHHLHARS